MKSSTETKTESNYDSDFSQIIILQNFVIFLANASFYTQKNYENFYIPYLFIASFIMTGGYFIYRITKNYCFLNFFINRYRVYTRTRLSRLIGILCMTCLIIRFLLSAKTVFVIQNTFLILAFIFITINILRFLLNRY